MCGLLSVISKRPNGFSRDQQDMFQTLLFVDMLRGDDSTGMFCVTHDGDVFGAKDEGNSLSFMNTKEYNDLQQKAWNRGMALVGHNRAATRGAISDKNAHPFVVNDRIVLVHNGTMRSDHKKHADVDVDSHAIAHLINEKDVTEALSSFHGAYALIWYDVEKGELNFIRNDERPLYWMETDDSWIWSSEESMLNFAVGRISSRVKVTQGPTSLPPDHLQKFILNNKSWSTKSEKLDIKKPVYPVYHQYGMGVGGGGGEGSRHYDEINWYEDYQRRKDDAACAWSEWEGEGGHHGSPPFRGQQHPRHGQAAVLLPKPQERAPQHVGSLLIKEPPELADTWRVERDMAERLNKVIPYAQWEGIVKGGYAYNTQQLCSPFDYNYFNGVDNSDGYYLYASPFDDEDVILRHYFPRASLTEERIMQLASCGYVFEFTLNQKGWRPIDPNPKPNDRIMGETPGYVVIRSSSAKLIATGQQRSEVH